MYDQAGSDLQVRNRAGVTARRFEQSGFAAETLCTLCSSAASHQAPCIINTCGKQELNRGDWKTPTAHSSTSPQLLASLAAIKLLARYSGQEVLKNDPPMVCNVWHCASPERAAKRSVNILELLGSLHAVGDGGVIGFTVQPSWTLLHTDQCF